VDCSRSSGVIFKKRETNPLSMDGGMDNSLFSLPRVGFSMVLWDFQITFRFVSSIIA